MLLRQYFGWLSGRRPAGECTNGKVAGLVAAVVFWGLTGCASSPKTFEIRGEADPVINRDTSGNPLSVVVHIYQLKDAEEFSKLTFDTLASGRPVNELLGKELLEKSEVLLVPGATYTSTEKLREETRHLGIVAFFRQPDQHYWRFLVDAENVRKNGLRFKVQDCFLALNGTRPSAIPGQPEGAPPACANTSPRVAAPAQPPTGASSRANLTSQIRKRAAPLENTGSARIFPN